MSDPVAEDPVLVRRSDGIAVVTMNRPGARNALNRDLLFALAHEMAALRDRDDVGVVILTGADPAFCAGVDLKERSELGRAALAGYPPPGTPTGRFWPPIGKPVIAAVNGPAITGGFEIALQCDMVVASERARFADTHARVGVMPGGGMSVNLARVVGVRRAKELSLTGRFVDADEASSLGLVVQVTRHDDLVPTCRRIAAAMLEIDSTTMRAMLELYDRVERTTAEQGLLIERELARSWADGGADLPERGRPELMSVIERGRRLLAAPSEGEAAG